MWLALLVQGGSLRTWPLRAPEAQVVLGTHGRPLDADVELWHGPDHAPSRVRVYSEDGRARPFSTVVQAAYGGALAVRNRGPLAFPLRADVHTRAVDAPSPRGRDWHVQGGGASRSFPVDASVESAEVLLRTPRFGPLHARVELLQGPDRCSQVVEVHNDDGRPFFGLLVPGGGQGGAVVRVINTAPSAFPLVASVEPHTVWDRFARRRRWWW